MSAERDPLDDLLAAISDGRPVDWDAATREAGPGARSRLASLRDVSRVADFSRDVQRETAPASTPERWGELVILERLGGGTHADVFRAWDAALERDVALKLMRPGADDAALLAEGRIAARVRHPHVVAVHGVDRRDGRVGLWMELVRGSSLEPLVRAHGALGAAEARGLGLEIGAALAAVHAAGVLHRDVKPANVMREASGRFVLADFGLGTRPTPSGTSATTTSGTPMYMAPERLAGGAATERSDVYSLGLLLWFALAGRHPFEARTLAELTTNAARGPRPALREVNANVPASLAAIVERAIAPDPERRFAAPGRLVAALEAWRPGRARTTRSAIAIGALAALVAIGFAVRPGRHAERPAPTTTTGSPPAAEPYAIEASFLRRERGRSIPLVTGDRVAPGTRLSLEVRATRAAWIYVLDEDERGERYLLFPQPRFDTRNPVAADSTFVLPGAMGGREQAWTVTSAGGREYLLVVASPHPVAEIEADLDRLPPARPGQPIDYAPVGDAAVERLRGVGGVEPAPEDAARPARRPHEFDRFRALAGRETGVHGVWVRQVVLENPGR